MSDGVVGGFENAMAGLTAADVAAADAERARAEAAGRESASDVVAGEVGTPGVPPGPAVEARALEMAARLLGLEPTPEEAAVSGPPPRPRAWLVRAQDSGVVVRLDGDVSRSIVIGRGAAGDDLGDHDHGAGRLVVDRAVASRRHCEVRVDGGRFTLSDLGSSNGTWFDKKRITRRRVEDGDEYFVCSEKLSCRVTY